MIQLWRERKGLLMGIVFNLILALKALVYMVLPFESAVPMDSVLYSRDIFLWLYLGILFVCLYFGLPLAICGYFLNKGQLNNGRISAVAVALCLTPFFAPVLMRKLVFEPRQLRTHCIICDGGEDSVPGYSLIPPDSRAAHTFPFRYVVK